MSNYKGLPEEELLDLIQELEDENEEYSIQEHDLLNKIETLEEDVQTLEEKSNPLINNLTSTLVGEMKMEFLIENWDNIKLEDLEAIIAKRQPS